MFFTLMVVNYQRKGTKGQTMIYKTLHRKQMTEQHVYIAARKQVAFLCEFRNLKRPKSETAAEHGHSLRILAQKVCIPSLRYSDIEPTVIDPYIHRLSNHEFKKHVQFHHPQTYNQDITFASEFNAFCVL